MTYLAAAERAALCDLALELGPDAPTLCGGWDVRDLLAHLVLRDGSLAAVGIVVPPLSGLADRGIAKLAEQDLEALVRRLRRPPLRSPFRLQPVDRVLNAMEYFVHHEDIRRAQPGWKPRDLSADVQDAIWRGLRASGPGLVRKARVGVVASRSDTSATAVLRPSRRSVTVQGLPSEVVLFVYGRKDHAQVELHGADDDIASLRDTFLGV